ncbi:MAG TPA: hypothetical protein VGO85_13180 [Caldimonas sp.]|jgi:hypothetical protein|nr:hypothetical protein [Caldimonas sp.]
MSIDSLSFTLRLVETQEDLAKVCDVRASGYGHHAPALREHMAIPDMIDLSPWTAVFLCEDKGSGAPIGTMRMQDNTRGGVQVEIEKYLQMPEWLTRSGGRCEMSRLVITPGADRLAKAALWKAGYLRCLAMQVHWLVIGARKPGLMKQYEYLGAKDMYEDRRLVPLGHGWNLPHRIFVMDVRNAARDWHEEEHRLLRFMVETDHPDISIESMNRPAAAGPRLSLVASA